ncbi:G protein-coupled receptor gpr1 [Rhinocladiella similis]
MLEALSDALLNARDAPIDYTGDVNGAGGSLKPSQNQSIHIAAVCCSSFSLLAALITLRWFLVMRRSFRHILVMNLIISDSFKAVWYFTFPIVLFAKGNISSSSKFCQATGFFLTFGVEAADMAIFLIALHSVLYILRPNHALGEGGLYPYRHWVWPAWLLPPLLAACLAFIRNSSPYITSGVFCSLPKRPIWYRLALSWVPRYMIIAFIISMYLWIYVYVHIKFRGFDKLGKSESLSESPGNTRQMSAPLRSHDIEQIGQDGRALQSPSRRMSQQPAPLAQEQVPSSEQLQPWDYMNFITSKPLLNTPEDGATPTALWGSTWSDDTNMPFGTSSVRPSRKGSEEGGSSTPRKENVSRPDIAPNSPEKLPSDRTDPLRRTRMAIRKQLRSMFVYPLVYIIVWTFPFVFQVRLYNAYYVRHPTYWINILSVIMLSLQAGADCILFSWTEKPWRRVASNSRFSILAAHRRSRAMLQRRCPKQNPPNTSQAVAPESTHSKRTVHWWEAEGRRRKDSVWLHTSTISDTFSHLASRTRSRSMDMGRRLPGHVRHLSEDVPSPMAEAEPVSPGNPPAGRGGRSSMSRVSSNVSEQEPRSGTGRGKRHKAGPGSLHKVKSNEPDG